MRTSIAILALAAVASASSFSKRQLPSCALTCITNANLGTCSATDNTCLCKSDAFVNSTYSCIASTCSGSDLNTAVAGARALCEAAGVSLTQTVPAATGTASSGAASTTSHAASATATHSSSGALGLASSPMVGAFAAVAGLVFAL